MSDDPPQSVWRLRQSDWRVRPTDFGESPALTLQAGLPGPPVRWRSLLWRRCGAPGPPTAVSLPPPGRRLDVRGPLTAVSLLPLAAARRPRSSDGGVACSFLSAECWSGTVSGSGGSTRKSTRGSPALGVMRQATLHGGDWSFPCSGPCPERVPRSAVHFVRLS